MATATSEVKLILTAKDQASKTLKGFSNNIKQYHRQIGIAMTAVGGAITLGMKSALDSAVSAQEIFNKFNTVFDDVGNSAEKVAKDLRDNWGLAESSAKDLLSSTGDLLSGFGFTGSAALDLSEKTQKMAIDLASFTNLQGGATRASEIITKALLGEKDSLVALGVKILDSDLKTRLLADGKADLTGVALRQAKAETTLQLIMEQSGKALGDYQRTSQSAANQQREMKERIKELSETIGTALIPVYETVLKTMKPIIEKVGNWIKENPKLSKTIILVVAALGGLLLVLGPLLIALPGLITLIGGLGTALAFLAANPIVLIIAAFVALGIAIYSLAKNWEATKDSLKYIWDSIMGLFSDGVDWVGKKIDAMIGFFDNLIYKIEEALKKLDVFNLRSAKTAWQNVGSNISWALGLEDLAGPQTQLADGGIVNRPTNALIGEAGPEAVIPLDKFTNDDDGLNLGSTIINNNFDFTGADTNDRESLIEDIENAIDRRYRLQAQGI